MCAPMLRLAVVALVSSAQFSDAFHNFDRTVSEMNIGVRKSLKQPSAVKPDGRIEGVSGDILVRRQKPVAKPNDRVEEASGDGQVRRQKSNLDDDQARSQGRQIKVALLFRGESFRAVSKIGPRAGHFGAAHRRTCEDESASHQQRFIGSHKSLIQAMNNLGIQVDVFGATYACQNGQDYTNQLPALYGSAMKAFDIMPKNGSFQLGAMSHVLRMALATGEKYDGLYILRWDYHYIGGAFSKMRNADCFVDAFPRIRTYFEGASATWDGDAMIYIPGTYAEQMLGFMEQDASPCCLGKDPADENNRHGKCGQSCVWCVRAFLASLNVHAKGMCSPCVPSEDCGQSLHESDDEGYGAPDTVDEEGARCR